jgi:NAD(P)H dehydrogenase (quinone)
MAAEWLNNKCIKFQILDLYQMNFDPFLKPDEHYTSGDKNITSENKKIQELIGNERNFIFIYPTWWNNLPAILKGFIDRVFTPGFAFKYENSRPHPLLFGQAIVFTTTVAPWFYTNLFAKNRSLKVLTLDALRFCGIHTKGFVLGNAGKLNKGLSPNAIFRQKPKFFLLMLADKIPEIAIRRHTHNTKKGEIRKIVNRGLKNLLRYKYD